MNTMRIKEFLRKEFSSAEDSEFGTTFKEGSTIIIVKPDVVEIYWRNIYEDIQDYNHAALVPESIRSINHHKKYYNYRGKVKTIISFDIGSDENIEVSV